MKAHGGYKVQLHSFLISALDEGNWSASFLSLFTPAKQNPGPIEQEPVWLLVEKIKTLYTLLRI